MRSKPARSKRELSKKKGNINSTTPPITPPPMDDIPMMTHEGPLCMPKVARCESNNSFIYTFNCEENMYDDDNPKVARCESNNSFIYTFNCEEKMYDDEEEGRIFKKEPGTVEMDTDFYHWLTESFSME